MLMGKFTHNLDAKNRLFIPAKHREQLGDSFVITCNVDKCLSVYSMAEWEKYTAKLSELPAIQSREIIRYLCATAAEVQPDAQGRVLIPADLIAYANIQKGAVIVGHLNYAEIWSEERWNEINSVDKTESILQQMMNLGL